MKKTYEKPMIEIEKFDKEDIITTSSYDPNNILDNTNFDKWFEE